MGKVIAFPLDKIKTPFDLSTDLTSMDTAKFVFQHVVFELQAQGYNLKDDDLQQDLGSLLNIIHAVMCRADGKYHFLSDLINELNEVISNIKRNEV